MAKLPSSPLLPQKRSEARRAEWLRRESALLVDESRSFAAATEAAQYLIAALRRNSFPAPQIVGHRIVHGGPHLRKHQRITPEVLRQLEKAVVFAPLHLPPALHVLRQAISDFPDAPHIACFDTPFIASDFGVRTLLHEGGPTLGSSSKARSSTNYL